VNPAQQEQLLDIGTYLQGVRKDKGKSVDEVANQIFIRPALVKAIESGDWESLPEPIFVQGFIRRYAEHLGLDGQELSQKFKPTPVSVLPNPQLANRGTMEGVVDQQDKHGLKVLSKAEPTRPTATVVPRSSPNRSWVAGLVAAAALLGLVGWLATRSAPQPVSSANTPDDLTSDDPEAATADPSVPEAGTAESATDLQEPIVLPDAEAADAAGSNPINFEVSLEGDAWMRVIADGEEVYEGILTTGTQQSWTAQNELVVTTGNSGEVLFSFNGSEEAPIGAPGAVSNLTLTPDTDPQAL
jgi:cytoskeletal protein RodZ